VPLAILGTLAAVVAVVAISMSSRDLDAPPNTSDLMLDRVEVADGPNAYTHFNAAVEALDWPADRSDEQKLIYQIIEGEKKDPPFVEDLVARNRRAIALVERGLRCRVCQPPAMTRIFDLQPHNITWRTLIHLLEFKMIQEQERGQYAFAARTCCDLIRFGDLMQRNPVDSANYVVGTSFMRGGLVKAQNLCDVTEITDADLTRVADTLAQIEPLDRGLIRTFKAEYQMAAAEVDIAFSKQTKPNAYDLQPNKTKQALADFYCDRIENASCSWADLNLRTPGEVFRRYQGVIATATSVNRTGRRLFFMVTESGNAMLETKCRMQCMVDGTRLIVACRRYKLDHGGLPPTLDALAPKYLDAVPRDPFDGKPFRYVRGKAIVYAIGMDLIDSGGSAKPTGKEQIKWDWQHLWFAEDAVLHLHGWSPPTDNHALRVLERTTH